MPLNEGHGVARGVEHGVRPPEHVVHPVDPLSREGLVLDSVARKFNADYEGLFKNTLEASRQELLRATEVAKSYTFDLNRFWETSRDAARNQYVFDKRTEKPWFDEINSKLTETDEKLKSQLAKWDEVTSPYADHYQTDEIYNAAHELRRTIESGMEKVTIDVFGGEQTDPVNRAKQLYSIRLTGALAGMAERINNRLGTLAAGKTAELVTISRQTKELLERTGKDPIAEKIAGEEKEARENQSEIGKNEYSKEGLLDLMKRELESSLELNRKDLTAQERQQLKEEQEKVRKALATFREALDHVAMAVGEKTKIANGRSDVFGDFRHLVAQKLTPKEFASRKDRWERAAVTLAGVEGRFTNAVLKTTAEGTQRAQERQERYQQLLDDAKTSAAKDPAGYWRKVKGEFFDQIEAVSGRELKETLNEAFKSDMAKQLQDWNDQSKRTRLDPVKLQEIATNLIATITNYSERAEFALRSETRTADTAVAQALQEAGDGVQAALAALRTAMTAKLQLLFDKGAFN